MTKTSSDRYPRFFLVGIAQHHRGWRKSFSIRVDPPFSDKPGAYVCPVDCSLIGKTRPARSIDARHAYALAFRFLRSMLSDFSLFTANGVRFELPRIAPYKDDWPRYEPQPERGFGLHGTAVGPDGELGYFQLGVSAPKPDGDGFATEVHFGRKEHPVTTVRGATVVDAYYAGVDWIADRLDTDRITLLNLWNEPLELPKRPRQ